MAQRIFTALVCDVHGGEHEASETFHYAVNGDDFRLDVCELGRRQVEQHLAVLTQVSTPTNQQVSGGSARLRAVASG